MAASPVEAAMVRGIVRVVGTVPAPAQLVKTLKAGQPVVVGCGDPTMVSPRLQVAADGGVRYAAVWLVEMESGHASAVPTPTAVLNQTACVFEPHVVTLPVGGEVAIRNSDAVLHNVRIFHDATMLMHAWQKADAADLTWRFAEPGRYVVRCGVHPWMYAWVVVAPGPAAVTDAAGRFVVPAVPAGRYRLSVWHEMLGTREMVVAVRSTETVLDPIVFPALPAPA